jgi:hypothetical protein
MTAQGSVTATSACPENDELVRLLDGELTENRAGDVRAHVDDCARCRDELAAYRQLVQAVAVPAAAAPGAEARTLARLKAAAQETPAGKPWFAWPRLALGFSAVAVAAAVLLVVMRPKPATEGEFTARGGGAHSLARDVDVEVYANKASLQRLRDGDVVGPDTPFAISYRNVGKPAFAIVFAVDAKGERHWIAPAYLSEHDDPASIALSQTTTDVVLPNATQLEGPASGALHVYSVVTAEPVHVSDVERMTGTVDMAALHRRWPTADIRTLTLELRNQP